MVRDRQRAAVRLGHLIDRNDFEIIYNDVTEQININVVIDFIIHAASQASPQAYLMDPVGTLNANVMGTASMLRLAHLKRCEAFLFFSSGAVCGEPPCIPFAETDYGYLDPATVQACYAEGKRVGETMCAAWSHQFAVPTRMVRPFHVYGPGIDLSDGRVFSDFAADILAGRNLILKSDGSSTRAFCYIKDATEGFFTVLLKGKDGTPYNIGNDAAYASIRELAKILVQDAFPEKNLKLIDAAPHDVEAYKRMPLSRSRPNLAKVSALGWEPKTGIVEGFQRTIASFAPKAGT
jgi:nucleoside-diphosphate-sugar epimerase